MGVMLEKSGVTEKMFQTVYLWAGGIRGGLAIGVVFICVILAAMCGIGGVATVTLGMVAIPPLLNRGYSLRMVTGCIQAGGALGILIPPSIVMVLYSMITKVSVGRLFAGGLFPGLLLALFYIIYIAVRCYIQPSMGPAMPKEERNQVSLTEKLVSLQSLILPVMLIFIALGSIFMGVASPTEASALCAVGAIGTAAINRRLTFSAFKEALFQTSRIMGMAMWIAFASFVFASVFNYLGGTELIEGIFDALHLGPWGVLILIQLSFFVLGAFLDDTAILFICMPVYAPIIVAEGFDPIWFGVLYVVNMQMAFITPPFGYCLFFMKGCVDELFKAGSIKNQIPMSEIYRSIIPYVLMQAVGLAVCMIFPQIILWLPNKIFGG
jgi:tripartite ATP-independent transporter DctM subunit